MDLIIDRSFELFVAVLGLYMENPMVRYSD